MEKIQDLTFISDDTPMIILFNNGEVRRAKEKEITNWILNNVFEEVEDEGQPTITVRWVITERVAAGDIETKARLVARGFEEQTSHLKKDSPTCAKEVVSYIMYRFIKSIELSYCGCEGSLPTR